MTGQQDDYAEERARLYTFGEIDDDTVRSEGGELRRCRQLLEVRLAALAPVELPSALPIDPAMLEHACTLVRGWLENAYTERRDGPRRPSGTERQLGLQNVPGRLRHAPPSARRRPPCRIETLLGMARRRRASAGQTTPGSRSRWWSTTRRARRTCSRTASTDRDGRRVPIANAARPERPRYRVVFRVRWPGRGLALSPNLPQVRRPLHLLRLRGGA